MIAAPMTAPKKTTKKAAPRGRKKSKLTLAGEAAQRGVLLMELKAQAWSLSATADALDLSGASDVLRAIKHLGLTDEYEAARARGDVKPGPKSGS